MHHVTAIDEVFVRMLDRNRELALFLEQSVALTRTVGQAFSTSSQIDCIIECGTRSCCSALPSCLRFDFGVGNKFGCPYGSSNKAVGFYTNICPNL